MKTISWLNDNLEKYITSILFMLFSGLMILNVIMRFIFQKSMPWASEAVLTIFLWFVWFGISYAFKQRAHIRVTAVVSLLPEKIQKTLEFVVSIGILIFFIIIFKTGIELLGHFSVKGKTSLLLNYPMWVFYLSSPIGIVLSIFRIIQNTYNDFKEAKDKK